MTERRFSFVVGGLIKILVNEPDGAPLARGSVVTIKALGLTQHDGASEPYAVVTPGDYRVLLKYAEPVATHDLVHPEVADLTDEEIASFEEIVDLDPLLRGWQEQTFVQVAEGLGEDVDDGLPPSAPVDNTVGLLEADETPDGRHRAAVTPEAASSPWPDEGRILGMIDPDSDELEIVFLDRLCAEHGLEACFRFIINEEQMVDIPVEYLGPILKFFQRWSAAYFTEKKNRNEPILRPWQDPPTER